MCHGQIYGLIRHRMKIIIYFKLLIAILKTTDKQGTCNSVALPASFIFHFSPFNKGRCSYLCDWAYLLYDWCLHATRLHLLLQEDLLLGLLDDVLSPIGSTDNLQDLTWETTKQEERWVHGCLAVDKGIRSSQCITFGASLSKGYLWFNLIWLFRSILSWGNKTWQKT